MLKLVKINWNVTIKKNGIDKIYKINLKKERKQEIDMVYVNDDRKNINIKIL